MPTEGSYEFKLANGAIDGLIDDAINLQPGEWAWFEQKLDGNPTFLAIYACCPDCKLPMTIWRTFGGEMRGHAISQSGDVSPSVLHSYKVGNEEKCGFHTHPTKLLNFVDRR